MKSHQIASKLKCLEKFHDSIRLVNRDDRNRSRASVKAAYAHLLYNMYLLYNMCALSFSVENKPHHEKTGFLPMRKQKRRSASQYQLISVRLCFRLMVSTISFCLNPKFQASSLLLRLYRPVCARPGLKPEDRFSRVAAQMIWVYDRRGTRIK